MNELAETLTNSWINICGTCIVVAMLIPNVIYAIKFRNSSRQCHCCKPMYIVEQTGRYGSMFLMAFNIGLAEFGFYSINSFIVYAVSNIVLTTAYLLLWILFFHRQDFRKSITLAVIPSFIFIISGITLRHILLISFAIIFAFSHIIITVKDSTLKDSCRHDSKEFQTEEQGEKD